MSAFARSILLGIVGLIPSALLAQSPRVLYTWNGTLDVRGWFAGGGIPPSLENTVEGELTLREAGSKDVDYLVSDDFNRIAEGAPSEGGLDLTGLESLAFELGHDGGDTLMVQFFVQATPDATYVALGPDQEVPPGDPVVYTAPLADLSREQIAYIRTVGFVVRAHTDLDEVVWTLREVRSEGEPLKQRDIATHEPGTGDNGLEGALVNFEGEAVLDHDPGQNQTGLRLNTTAVPPGNTGSLEWVDVAGRGGAAITWGNGTSLFQGNTFWERPVDLSSYTQIVLRIAATNVIEGAVASVGVQYFLQSGNFQFRVAGGIQQLPADGEFHELVFPIASIPSLFSVEQHGLNFMEHLGGDLFIDVDFVRAVRLDDFLDCNRNGLPDVGEIADGRSKDCNLNGVPDECDIARGSSSDCNANRIPDDCDIGGEAFSRVLYTWEGVGDPRGWMKQFGANDLSFVNDVDGELTIFEEGQAGKGTGFSEDFNAIAEGAPTFGGLDLLGATALEFELGHSGFGDVQVQFFVQATPDFLYIALGPDQPIHPGVERYVAPLTDLTPAQLSYIRAIGINVRDHDAEGNLIWTIRELSAKGVLITQRDIATHEPGSSDRGLQGAMVNYDMGAIEGNDASGADQGQNQTGLSHNTSAQPPGNTGALHWVDLPGQNGGAVAWFIGTVWNGNSYNERPLSLEHASAIAVRMAATNVDAVIESVGLQYYLQTGNFEFQVAGETQVLPADGQYHELVFPLAGIPNLAYVSAHGIDLFEHEVGKLAIDVDSIRALTPGLPEKDCNLNRLPDGCDIASGASRDREANGVPDECERRLPDFRRGDCNGDGNTSGVGDAVTILTINFVGGAAAPCRAACDVNGDGNTAGVGDAVTLLTNNFVGGVSIPPPYPGCGASDLPSDETLGCQTPTAGCN